MSNIFDSNTKFNKVYMFIGNTITVVTACIGAISLVVKEVTKKSNSLPPILNTILSWVIHFCIILFILGITAIIVRIVYVGIKVKSKSYYIQRKITELLHNKLIHKVRDNIVELELIEEKVKKYAQNNSIEAISECYENEIITLQNNIKSYVDTLSDFLSEYRNSTISVCVKIFRKRDKNREDYLSEEILIFVRSTNTMEERSNDKITIVNKNTDFTNLCRGENIFFGSSNLQKIYNNGQYINDSDNYNQNKYKSTLVTPIRYYNNTSDNLTLNNNIKPDIIGFLCIDSKEEIAEWEEQDSFELQLLAAFSDILYVYIKEFYKCFENGELYNGGILK